MKTYRMVVEYWVPDENENLYEDVIISHERIKIKRPRDFFPPPDIKINIRTPNISKTYQRIL
jgi:hypothetical protein